MIDDSQPIRCIIRIKPPPTNSDNGSKNSSEKEIDDICLKANSTNINLKSKEFIFDWVADESVSQQEFFNNVANPVINSFFQGKTSTIYTYGQSGSGKSYTMYGPIESIYFDKENPDKVHNFQGIISRILKTIFDRIHDFNHNKIKTVLSLSCLEIYKENIIDLLGDLNDGLTIYEHAKKGLFIDKLCEQEVDSYENALDVLLCSLSNQRTSEIETTSESPRSHFIFIINLVINSNKDDLVYQKYCRMNLIDLAGSERNRIIKDKKKALEDGDINKYILYNLDL